MANFDPQRITSAFSTRHWSFIFNESAKPTTVGAALISSLPQIDPHSWPERAEFGGIYLNGRRTTLDQTLGSPARVEYYEPLFDFRSAEGYFPAFSPNHIVYQDEDLVIAHKPPRLPTQPAREQQHFSLKHSIEKFLGETVHMPSRLDMSAQGLVLISRAPRAHAKLQRMYEQRTIDKFYLLAVSGQVPWAAEKIDAAIAKDPRHPVLRRTVTSGGKPAVTDFKVLARREFDAGDAGKLPITILVAKPETGRTHQLRVHSAALGFPIVGDNFYGGYIAPELHLVSARLGFTHPFSGQPLSISLPATLGPLWAREFLS